MLLIWQKLLCAWILIMLTLYSCAQIIEQLLQNLQIILVHIVLTTLLCSRLVAYSLKRAVLAP